MEVFIFDEVEPVVIAHSSALDGAKSEVAHAPNVPHNHGFTASCTALFMKFIRFRIAFETS